ncbi:hypothetical protein [Nonomuraea sp. KM90]|uniref:hypothetical protein n=1 Tax=Nonomuraea sp. KM90 TaxID=3457428 RepID=UPI003FCE9787
MIQRWQILSITYWDDLKTKEMSRYLYSWPKYWRYKSAMREVRRRENEDTLENRFTKEYVVVKAV